MSDQRVHSRFGGSSASRWMNCPGSVALCESVPARPSSGFADEGTWAHAVGAYCLEQGYTADTFHTGSLPLSVDAPAQYIGQIPDREMCDAVQVYLDAVNAELNLSPGAELFVEKGFVLDVETAQPGEVFGTNDALVYHPDTGRLRIFDYKHGVGVSVSADDNAQLKFYAAGAVFSHPEWAIREIVLTIVQPRARDNETPEDAVRDWTFVISDLLDFIVDVEAAIDAAKAKRAFTKTGSWCRWCDAAAICPAREIEALDAAAVDFASVTLVTAAVLPEPKTLDVERLAKIVGGLSILSAWAAQCQEYLEGLVLSGHEVPGWKAVEKIGRAKWIEDPTQVVGYASLMFGLEEDQIMPRKLTTIGEAEKLLKGAGASKDDLDSFKLKFTLKESSGLTVAPASDRRPAINAAQSDFDQVKIA